MTEYRYIEKHPDKAYLTNNLLLPKKFINERTVKAALTFFLNEEESIVDEVGQEIGTRPRSIALWDETATHLIVPREFVPRDHEGRYNEEFRREVRCEFEYLPAPEFERVRIDDHIELRDQEQRVAYEALVNNPSGTLNLSCVAGDTVLNLNRGGKGFKTTIAQAYERSKGSGRYAWDQSIPTRIRADKGGAVGLHCVHAFLYQGKKLTYTLLLADGKQLRLTSDHEVLTTNGWKSIDSGLKPGDEVVTDGEDGVVQRSRRRAYKRICGFRHHPYARPQKKSWRTSGRAGRLPKDEVRVKNLVKFSTDYVIEEHRAVAEAQLNGVTLEQFRERCRLGDVHGLKFIDPSVFHVHHRDHDITNNAPGNLEIMAVSAHHGEHGDARNFGYGSLVPARVLRITKGLVEDVYDVVCEDPYHNFVANGVVVHNCGKGKTVIALKAAATLKVPTLVVVNTTALLEQWKEEIQRHLGVDSVGTLQGTQLDWEGHPIVLAMVHTLSGRKNSWPLAFRKRFGLVLYDEGHHMSAPVFVLSADMFFGKRFSLTATASRTDGLEVIYQYHLGHVIHHNLTQDLIPNTVFHTLKWEMPPEHKKMVEDKNQDISMPRVRSYLGRLKWRNDIIYLQLAQDLSEGRNILVLSHSVSHVERLYGYLSGAGAGMITGDTQQDSRMAVLRNGNPVFGTFQLAREGLNKPSLDTLYITTPFSNSNDLQQSWGRIQRRFAGKKEPLVRVFEDSAFSCCTKSCGALRATLRRFNYPYHKENKEIV